MIPTTIPYSTLVSLNSTTTNQQLSELFNEAFGSSPTSLGLLLVSNLPPSFLALRKRALVMAHALATSKNLRNLERPPSYSYGWSHGKESMSGKLDLAKGSFYFNPVLDDLFNVWPNEDECVGFKEAVSELCDAMCLVGRLVARGCDGLKLFKEQNLVGGKSIEELIVSKNSKARLLHYFPPPDQVVNVVPSSTISNESTKLENIDDSWCGTHLDHSILTALCPAIYLFHPTAIESDTQLLEPLIIPSPSSAAGLFIKTRSGKTIKASIPEDCLAFQTGETIELLSSGALAATPHFVNASASSLNLAATKVIEAKIASDSGWSQVKSGVVSRETMAVFLQPNADEVVSSEGETFGQFSDRVLLRHY